MNSSVKPLAACFFLASRYITQDTGSTFLRNVRELVLVLCTCIPGMTIITTVETSNRTVFWVIASCFAYPSTLKMEAICACERSERLRTTRCYSPECHSPDVFLVYIEFVYRTFVENLRLSCFHTVEQKMNVTICCTGPHDSIDA
jgi:hypothetical protein